MQPTQVFLPVQFHRQRLAGYSPWGRKESDTTEQLTLSLPLCSIQVGDQYQCVRFLFFSWLVLKSKRRANKQESLIGEGRTDLSYLHYWKTIMDEEGAENLRFHFDNYSIFFPLKLSTVYRSDFFFLKEGFTPLNRFHFSGKCRHLC